MISKISYLGPKIWDIVPDEFKNKNTLKSFKESIKMWLPTNCPYRLCKVYLDGVGFTNNFPANTSFQINNDYASNFWLFTFTFVMNVKVARMWILFFYLQLYFKFL